MHPHAPEKQSTSEPSPRQATPPEDQKRAAGGPTRISNAPAALVTIRDAHDFTVPAADPFYWRPQQIALREQAYRERTGAPPAEEPPPPTPAPRARPPAPRRPDRNGKPERPHAAQPAAAAAAATAPTPDQDADEDEATIFPPLPAEAVPWRVLSHLEKLLLWQVFRLGFCADRADTRSYKTRGRDLGCDRQTAVECTLRLIRKGFITREARRHPRRKIQTTSALTVVPFMRPAWLIRGRGGNGR